MPTTPSEAPRAPRRASDMPLGGGPDAQSTFLARRIVYFLVVVGLATAVGLALPQLEPLLVAGFLVSALILVAVVRWPYVGLLAYLLIFFLRIGEVYPALAPLRLERIVGVMTLASLFLRQLYSRRGLYLDSSRPTHLLLVTVLAAFLSVPLAYWRFGATQGAITFVKILVLYVLVVHLVDTRAKLRGFLWLYTALIAYLGSLSVIDYFHGALMHAQGIDRAVGATSAGGGPNEMGATMATTIPLFLLLGFHRRLGAWRFLFLAGLALLLVTMVLTGSRSALVGFFGGMSYLWWRSRHRVVLGIVGAALMVGGFFLLPEQYQGRYSTMTQAELDGSSQARVDVWLKGLKMVMHRPLTGVGIECFGTANAMDFSAGSRRSYLESHSLYVQVPAEMGLIGAFAFFGFLYTYMRMNRRVSRVLEEDEEDWSFEVTVLRAIFVGSIVLLFTGVFGHSMLRRTWYIYAALGVCMWRIHFMRIQDLGRGGRS